ncbi:hypothetical protein Y032_0010g1071 [Ancylostoma ceylanicum]|uniref:Uncharacterized protein n=2 Tax=Ancylostoma ceylanicum TaxID=53326 RepID=A0A016VF76_9BILA|nr:hypothetical protein Y032_0010g1071 [Ancylostoma ceylanicum]
MQLTRLANRKSRQTMNKRGSQYGNRILLLCVGALLAAGRFYCHKCKGSKVSAEIKQQILDFHRDRREGDAMEWDCDLEAKARGTMRNATTLVDYSKIGKKRGLNFFEYDKEDRKQYKEPKDIVRFVLDYWWARELYAKCNVCAYPNNRFSFAFIVESTFLNPSTPSDERENYQEIWMQLQKWQSLPICLCLRKTCLLIYGMRPP